jgi:hypothetical protein
MVDSPRRAKLLRELEQDFVPDYDAQNLPSADKRAAYALEHIAFRVSRMEQTLARIAAVIEAALSKP